MKIKMPIKFFGNYQVIIRSADSESEDRCQKLAITPLSSEKKDNPPQDSGATEKYQIVFHDAGCRRIIVGTLKENLEEKVVFQVEDREYEFSPL